VQEEEEEEEEGFGARGHVQLRESCAVSCTKRFFQKCRTTRGESRLWQVGVRVGVRVGVERAVGVVALLRLYEGDLRY
jgi:hypothetical protein